MYHDDYLQTAQQVKDSQLGQQQCGVQADPNYNPPGAPMPTCLGDRNICETKGYYEPSHAEQAEKRTQYHLSEASKAQQASHFFRAHPEFEEFIKLIRSGAVQL